MYLGFSTSKIVSIVFLLLALLVSLILSDIPCVTKWRSNQRIEEGYTASIQQKVDNELYSDATHAEKIKSIDKLLTNSTDVKNDIMSKAYMDIINSTDYDDAAKIEKMKKIIIG
jgi:hypothetical protein